MTDEFIALTGATDLRGTLPTRAGVLPYPRRPLADIRWFVVHHTGDGPTRPTARDVAAYQTGPTAGWPFPAMAYGLFVAADGTLEVINDAEQEDWSNGVGSPSIDANGEGIYNQETWACCFSGQDPTDAQWATILRAKAAADEVLGLTLTLTGHGLLPNGGTSCPGPVATGRLHAP